MTEPTIKIPTIPDLFPELPMIKNPNVLAGELNQISDLPKALALILMGRSSLSSKCRRAIGERMFKWTSTADIESIDALNKTVFDHVVEEAKREGATA